jgi:membrane-associated protease RseP (regulator of RpoE activity)
LPCSSADPVQLDEHTPGDGVRVLTVALHSAAAEAGIEPGQRILAIDGELVHTTAELQRAVRAHEPGADIEIGIQRVFGRLESLPVTLQARWEDGQRTRAFRDAFTLLAQVLGGVLLAVVWRAARWRLAFVRMPLAPTSTASSGVGVACGKWRGGPS